LNKDDVVVAGHYPLKLLWSLLRKGADRFVPEHVSLNPTNRCQLKCSYCCVSERDMKMPDMSKDMFLEIMGELQSFGRLKAVTLTGGGEPTLHPHFEGFVAYLTTCNIKVGLVTNGLNLSSFPIFRQQGMFDWIRVSFDGERKELPLIPEGARVGFSWMWREVDRENRNLWELVRMAKEGKITHLRIGNDILSPSPIPSVFQERPNVIVQDRQVSKRGSGQCWLGLLHPKVDVDGEFYPCCGVQYAVDKVGRKYPKENLGLRDLSSFMDRVKNQEPFCGGMCRYCFYWKSNNLLSSVKAVHHLESKFFI